MLPVLFEAAWCPFCAMFKPLFESFLDERGISRGFVDLSDLENPLWETFDIRVVPTVILFKDGEPVFRKDGVQGRGLSAEALEEIVKKINAH